MSALAALVLFAGCGADESDADVEATATDGGPVDDSTADVEPREVPDDYAEVSYDFPYERLEEMVVHVDAVGRGSIVDIVGGRTSSFGQNRALVIEVERWWTGPGGDTVVVEDGSWWDDGKTYAYEGEPWFVTGDDVFFLVHDSGARTDGQVVFEATNPFGVVLADAPVPRPWLAQLAISTTAEEYEGRLDAAVAAIDAGEVDFITPEERLLLVETWTGEPATIAAAVAADGTAWELQVVETAVGFCYWVGPAGDTIPPGTGCWQWESFVDGLQEPFLLPVGDGSLFVAAANVGDPLTDEYPDLRVDPATVPFAAPDLPVDFYFGPTAPADG